MSARSKARKRALDMLYLADVRHLSLAEVIAAEAQRAVGEPDRLASWTYAREIVDGVNDHRDEIDEQLQTVAQGWALDRMPNIDRSLLRIATWELLYNENIPVAVAIDEAVELAKEYSTADSGKFVNGVLGRISDLSPRQQASVTNEADTPDPDFTS